MLPADRHSGRLSMRRCPEKTGWHYGAAFLRVVQEALHNVAKHSRAKKITVRLNGSDHQLRLEIRDDGVGFDMETAKLAAGLGLISMRERIHLIGGEFEIVLQPRKRHADNSPRANSPGNRLNSGSPRLTRPLPAPSALPEEASGGE